MLGRRHAFSSRATCRWEMQFVLWALRQWQCELSAWERDGAFPAAESGLRDGFRMALAFSRRYPNSPWPWMPSCSASAAPSKSSGRPAWRLVATKPYSSPCAAWPKQVSVVRWRHRSNAMLGPEAAEVVRERLATFAAMLGDAGLDLASAQADVARRLH